MTLAIVATLVGLLLVTSALKGKSVAELLRDGLGIPFDPSAGPSNIKSEGFREGGFTPITGNSRVIEVFYDPLGGWKNGVSIGAIGGHDDHVHIAGDADTINYLEQLANTQYNLRTSSKLRPFDIDSHHGPDKPVAVDLIGNPRDMMAFAQYVVRNYV